MTRWQCAYRLSAEAQAEARILMLSTNNILKPADGKQVTMPTQDMVIEILPGTRAEDGGKEGRLLASPWRACMAYDRGELDLQAKIGIRLRGVTPPRQTRGAGGRPRAARSASRPRWALHPEALPATSTYVRTARWARSSCPRS